MNAKNINTCWSDLETPLGRLTLTANERGLEGLFFPGSAPGYHEYNRAPERFQEAITQLHEYFAGARREFDLQLDLTRGTALQRAVWRQLQRLPYGTTISYGRLAAQLDPAQPAVRAVAAAVARTPLPIVVPCHRVIGSDGSLTGYVGGLPRKQELLELEAAISHGQAPPTSFDARQLSMI